MALIPCSACSKEISQAASACPNCGHPTRNGAPAPPAPRTDSRPWWQPVWLTVLLAVGLWCGHQVATGAADQANGVEAFGGNSHGSYWIVALFAYGVPVGIWALIRRSTT